MIQTSATSPPSWLALFGLSDRIGTPDLFLSPEVHGIAHAGAMRAGFAVGVSAYLSIGTVPTVAFLISDDFEQNEIDRVHKALWNQGLASLLVVLATNVVRVYSLWRRPVAREGQPTRGRDKRLVEVLELTSDALAALRGAELINSVESGRYFEQHGDAFDKRSRVDTTLLENLRMTHKLLFKEGLSADASRALLLQTIFIAYLEDRGIIEPEYYEAALSGENVDSWAAVLERRDVPLLDLLFAALRKSFNGDIFHAPSSFDPDMPSAPLAPDHLGVLATFRSGLVRLESGQGRFWPYSFEFIPVELISAIYDRFLNDSDEQRRAIGAYYTPRFVADLTVDLAWQEIGQRIDQEPLRILDPACGSAIFLVRLFQRLVEDWRSRHPGQEPDWELLKGLLASLHGWDKQPAAVRIGVFSLYVALLEQVYPPAIKALMEQGKVLPELFGRNLRTQDYFETKPTDDAPFDLIIGNPPWVSKKEDAVRTAQQWCEGHGYPMPGLELAWAFLWKSQQHLARDGRAALLLPAMGIFLNHNRETNNARARWSDEVELVRVVNFADLRFQLFEGADRPTVLVIYRVAEKLGREYRFDYWVPKANRLLSSARLLTIASLDQSRVSASTARREPQFWKRRMWATGRDLKLLSWLTDLPGLGRFIQTYHQGRRRLSTADQWMIGQGFQELHRKRDRGLRHGFTDNPLLPDYPFLETEQFRPWVIPTIDAPPWPTTEVRRAGFSMGYAGPHILVIKGIQQQEGVLRAAYVEQGLSFRHSIQSIRFPKGQETRAKLLTAILNSRLAGWFYFHTTASLGAERPEVHQRQLLTLPFPAPEDLSDPNQARRAEQEIIRIIDTLLARKDELLVATDWMDVYIEEANRLVCDYYGLTDDERIVVDETVRNIVPSVQPHRGALTPLLKESTEGERTKYALTIATTLDRWVNGTVQARLLEGAREWSLVELSLSGKQSGPTVEVERRPEAMTRALERVMASLPVGSSHNVQLRPDFKIFLDDALFLVKPPDTRFWLRIAALNDADEIAGDLLLQHRRKVMTGTGNGDHW
ncbi:MAG: N-6 DNA methylase [Bryobacteraceae bacterium]